MVASDASSAKRPSARPSLRRERRAPTGAVVAAVLALGCPAAGPLASPDAAAVAPAPALLAAPPSGRTQRMGVRTARATQGALAPTLSAPAHVAIDPSAVLAVGVRAAGWIASVAIGTGERVSRGDVLATMKSPELAPAQQAFIEAAYWASSVIRAGGRGDAALEARRRLERLGVAPEDVDALARRSEPLDELPIRAPAAGWIWARRVAPGAYVLPGATLFDIADLSRVRVVIAVAAADAPRVKVGQAARLSFPALPDDAFTGKIRFVAPAASAETRTVAASVVLDNRELKLLPGMYGEATVEVGPVNGLVVPAEAVTGSAAPHVLVKHAGGRLEPRRVRLGLRAGDRVQVLDGLVEGEEVVAGAVFLIDSESALEGAFDAFAGEPRTSLASAP